jgi:hypothetical protein
MTWLPGWDSPESVERYRTLLENWSGTLVVLGGILGALAFIYNHRQSELDRADKLVMQQQVSAANDGALQASQEAKRLKMELDAEKQGRLLSPDKLTILTQHLHSVLNPKAKIDLSGIEGDRESMRLAEQLAPIFRDAGFTVNDPYETSVIGGVGKGIAIRQASIKGLTGTGIAAAFAAVGIESRVIEMGPNRGLGPDDAQVIVGRRP